MALNIAVYLFVTLPLSSQTPSLDDPAVQEYLRSVAPDLANTPVQLLISQLDRWSLFVFEHGYKPGAPQISDLFTSMFMHGGFMHLAGNMLFLWIYGDNVEHRFGRPTFLAVYVGTGVAATLAFALFADGSMVPLVGASGAISGVLGCYFLLFPRNRVKVFVALFPFIFTTILVPARIVLGVFLIIDNLFPALFRAGGGGGVAYGAHIGGFVAGLAVALVLDRMPRGFLSGLGGGRRDGEKKRARVRAPAGQAPAGFRTVADAEGALRAAVRQGDRAEAVRQARGMHPAQILEYLGADVLVLAEWLADADEPILAMTLLRRALTLGRGEIDQARLYLTLGLVRLAQGQPTAAYQHILAVFDHDPDPETEDRAREALKQIAVN